MAGDAPTSAELPDAADPGGRERSLRVLQHYSEFFGSPADGSFVVDLDGTILLCNSRAVAITGYRETELIDRHLLTLLTDHEQARCQALLRRCQRECSPDRVDLRFRHQSGRVLTLRTNATAVLRDERTIVLMFQDVTEECANEIDLKPAKEILERIIDSSLEAIVAFDMTGQVLLFNRAAERCYGHAAEEVIGRKRIDELYPPELAQELLHLISGRERGGPGRLEDHRCDIVDGSGRNVPVTVSATLLCDTDAPVVCVTLLTDLRERVCAEQRLESAPDDLRAREKQTAIAELAGAAAHELNQPLTSVMGYAQLLRRRLEHHESMRELADVILAEAERMAEIVRKIGRITKYETKTYVGTAKILDIDKASKDDTSMPRKPEEDP